ncbi:MAG TPA: GNAT family N-acetyltransferase [Bacteroidales bacterium]|nr:GNAT family N-acetyltransferase [Bacteroidales bacterium]
MDKLLENKRIRLRALEPEDLDSLYRWENDDRLWAFGSTLTPFSRFVLRQYIENSGQDLYEAKQLRLMIIETATDEPVGTIDLYDFDPFHLRAGIGILIDAEHQKQGFAIEALNLMKGYAFHFLQLNQLYAFIPAMNIASQHLFRRCGFTESGLLRKWNKASQGLEDVYVYQCFPS